MWGISQTECLSRRRPARFPLRRGKERAAGFDSRPLPASDFFLMTMNLLPLVPVSPFPDFASVAAGPFPFPLAIGDVTLPAVDGTVVPGNPDHRPGNEAALHDIPGAVVGPGTYICLAGAPPEPLWKKTSNPGSAQNRPGNGGPDNTSGGSATTIGGGADVGAYPHVHACPMPGPENTAGEQESHHNLTAVTPINGFVMTWPLPGGLLPPRYPVRHYFLCRCTTFRKRTR